MNTTTTAQALALLAHPTLDAREWTPSNGGPTRIYINNWAAASGHVTRTIEYGRETATVLGETVSKAKAQRALTLKIWWTATDGFVIEQGDASTDLADAVAAWAATL